MTETPACWKWRPPGDVDLRRARRAVSPEYFDKRGETGQRRLLMVVWQKERCGMCGIRWPRQVIDHDHETGLIRGYLCRSCNTLEGSRGPGCEEFSMYRERNPASICGYRDYYYDPFLKAYAGPEGWSARPPQVAEG